MGEAHRLVAVRLPGGPGFVGALRGAWERGDAVLPVSTAPADAELGSLLERTRPSLLIDGEGEHRLAGGEPVAHGVALVVATSGSAGEPKGVELTHDALGASAAATAARLGAGPDDRWLCCLPVHHVAGLMTVARSILAGAEPAFESASGATLVSLVPTQLVRLLDGGADLSRFRWVLLGGGPVPPVLVARATSAGARIVATYGMTETCGGVVYDGVPLEGVDVRAPAGEIELRGPMLMRGYRLRPDLTEAALRDGWLRTGDLGEIGAGGRLTVLGRRDEAIVTGGEKVAPAEVEAVLAGHPLVADAGVAGVPDADWGERVVAVVVPSGERAPSLGELREFVKERLAAHKAPRGLVLAGRLPRTESGKLLRGALREMAVDAGPSGA